MRTGLIGLPRYGKKEPGPGWRHPGYPVQGLTHHGRSRSRNLDSSAAPSIKKSRFTAFFVRENALDKRGFKEWVFSPGMLFHALDTWWGDQGRRDRPHEGLDLCQYRDQRDRMHALDEKMKVPAMYDGIVVRIVHDFLGRSVILEHRFRDSDKGRFYTMYGHTKPRDGLHVGRIVKQGDIIATLADSTRSKAGICPHLHVSLGWAPGPVSYDKLDWETIGASHTLALLDPLPLIDPASR